MTKEEQLARIERLRHSNGAEQSKTLDYPHWSFDSLRAMLEGVSARVFHVIWNEPQLLFHEAKTSSDAARILAARNAKEWLKTPNFGKKSLRELCDFTERHGFEIPGAASMFEPPITDARRLDWLETKHTLHGAVAILYVVDGYKVQLTHDYDPVGVAFYGETLRDAIDGAMRAEQGEKVGG